MFQEVPQSPLNAPPARPSLPVSPVEEPPWRLRDVIAGSLLLCLGFVATVGVGVALRGEYERSDPATGLLFTVATLLLETWAGAIVIGLAWRRGISMRGLGFRAPSTRSLIPLALAGAYASIIGYTLAIMAIEWATGADLAFLREGNRIPEDLPRTPLIWTAMGLAVVVAAPLGEELFFRGLVYRGLAGIGGPALGIIVSGLAFAAMHATLSVVVPFALIGMIFAWAYRASGSLWTIVAAHAIFNSAGFAAALYGVPS